VQIACNILNLHATFNELNHEEVFTQF